MKKSICILCLISSLGTFGQKDDNLSRWQIGINLSPNDVSYKKAELIGYGSYYLSLMDQPRFGYTGSINLLVKLQKHLSLETGLQYSKKGYQSKKRASYDPPVHAQNVPKYATLSSKFSYLGVPLRVVFKSSGERLRFIGSVGATAEFLISSITVYQYEYANGDVRSGSNKDLDTYNRITVTPFASAGIEAFISSRFNFRIEPIFRYSALKLENASNGLSKTFLWSAGLNLGLYYNI